MHTLIDLAVSSKRLIITLLVMILGAGFYAYFNIVKEEQPDIPFPVFLVNMAHDGISPEDSERLLIKPMETHMRSIEGIKELTAVGREGGAYIILEFYPDVDQDRARTDVREAVDMGKSRLPEDTLEPLVNEFSTSEEPVITIVLHGTAPEQTMVDIVRTAREELEAQPLILEAETQGERDRMLEVLIDPRKLANNAVTPQELLNVVQRNNRLVAAGAVSGATGRFSVRVDGLVENANDVLSLPIKSSPDGVVTLGDITDVRRTFKEATSLARYDGQPAFTIEVKKRSEANAVEAANSAKAVIAAMSADWPESVRHDYLFDQSVEVSDFLATLRNNVVSAIVLVSIIIVAALGGRSALLVGISVPGSFLFGILLLYFTGNSINNVVMFGLILSVGLLVDGAIVVTEYADRKMVEGLGRDQAYRMAAKRMAMPILSSTLTTMAAFLPIVFWPDVIGKFMAYIPITVIYTLIGSFLMAMIFLPTLGAVIGRPSQANPGQMQTLAQDSRFDVSKLRGITRWYGEILTAVTRHPGRVLAGTAAIMALIVVAYVQAGLGSRAFADTDPPYVRLLIHARGNMAIEQVDSLVRQVEDRVRDTPGIEAIWSTTMTNNSDIRGSEDVVGRINLMLEDWFERAPVADIKADLRARVADVPGIRVELAEAEFGPIQGKDVQIRVSAENPGLITPVVAAIRDRLAERDDTLEVEDTRHVPGIDWSMRVNRAEAGRFGTDVTTVGGFIQLMTNGLLASRYRPADTIEEEDIRIRFPAEYRGIQAMDDLMIQTPVGGVPISNLVERAPTQKVGKITRVNMERAVTISANVQKGVLVNRVVGDIKGWIKDQGFDRRVGIHFEGSDEVQQDAASFLVTAMVASLALMGLILLAQFNSFYQTLLILTSVVMATIGVLFGLLVSEREFSVIMTGMGIVALAGIVVNNNIVLIDTFNRLKSQGIPAIEAIIHTGAQRLRPVLLTTTTTMIGLLPMALKFNIDFFTASMEFGSPNAKFWVDLAVAVVWGLGIATILTLVITPAALALPERWRLKKAAKRAEKAAPDESRTDPATGSAPGRKAAE
ncbi:efflux RND transporter permease subunit [Yunchengibacter salinarum]|uniref:efflux RND transporter permease subunit n=1 Tax=Yunchengibacter salinarum TaxID=3133399 RepID=UPI0035B69719